MKPEGFASSLYVSSPRFALAGSDRREILSRQFPWVSQDPGQQEFVASDIRIVFHLSIEDLELLQLVIPHRVEVSRERSLQALRYGSNCRKTVGNRVIQSMFVSFPKALHAFEHCAS
jgi:hypothetical protein